MRIDNAILTILSSATIEENVLRLTCGQLERKKYVSVNKVLEDMGGKWNTKIKGHVFDGNPIDKLEAVLLTGELVSPKKYGYFQTPPELAYEIVLLAKIEAGHIVLEPSAGRGAIAKIIPKSVTVHCVELLPDNVKILEEQGFKVIQGDFLALNIDPIYDRIIMNPPFERQADIDHVLKAWECLKPLGRLISIMASGVTFRGNRKSVEFRELVHRWGYLKHNSDGMFKDSGTMVSTVTVVMDKPAGMGEAA